ncbi:hypothetical protein ACTI_19310 [Actinoplanes sp. OR16]|uniref:DUF4132 domain-containing protein n=1 Tax=Actinoplanes sp. OR16 TaxID=946334 RepID=UPI000F6D569D|nr:DUF4132 domain-containing protein [Actinoplanes sp. OR16]BBH65246.1 hypothetical protein ACTI_19310 [Actinoplanes sp. OR16]
MESPYWHRHRFPRHGSAGVSGFVPDPGARAVVQEQIGRRPGMVTNMLASPTTDPSTAAAARAWLDGSLSAPPIGPAAVAAITGVGSSTYWAKQASFADLLIAERGLRFAAEAAVLVNALTVIDDDPSARQFLPGRDDPGVRHLRSGENRQGWQIDAPLLVLLRVRRALAAASDAAYEEVVQALLPYRSLHRYAAAATSILVPSRHDWVEEDVLSAIADKDSYRASALTTAVSTGEQLDALVPIVNSWTVIDSTAVISTILDGVGPAAAPAFFHWFDEGNGDAAAQKRLLAALAAIPADDVMRGLIERVEAKYVVSTLTELADRDPARALRLFVEGSAKRPIADLLRGHVLSHPSLADESDSPLVKQIVEEARSLVIAPLSAVPALLVDPPWLHRTKFAKPIVINGLTCTDPAAVHWLPGEREQWEQTAGLPRAFKSKLSWPQIAERLLTGRGMWSEASGFFTRAPEIVARPIMRRWRAQSAWEAGPWLRVAVARFEIDALPALLDLNKHGTAETAALLMPFTSPELAVLTADWLARLKSLRGVALAWLLRHPVAAGRALIPPALGKAGPARRQAENALLTLHTHGQGQAVREASQQYGPEAAAAIETLLATDPLAVLPAKVPPNPAWAVPGMLPPVRLRDGSGALPASAVEHLVTMLALSKIDSPYAGLAIVQDHCEPGDLAEFAWGVFHRWQSTGAEAKENWTLDALGLLGDDETVRRLTPLILTWPGDGGHQKAVTGVTVLSTIGSDVALMHLHGIAQRAKFKGLKTAAQTRMAEVAESLGLTPEQLADRLVPDLGLSSDGSLRLDYGPRQFVVGFDEQLKPFVTDAAGKRLKSLPKPGARDDADLAPAAFKQFAALKKDVRTIAADQVRRLEQAMVRGRRWSVPEFQQFFVDHPLVWHVSRRLVWLIDGRAFRIAEDRTFSTVDDDELTLPADARVGVAHPLHLGGSLAAWTELFADYEILQPFPQLGRSTYELTAESLTGFENITVPTTKILGLERRGWRREEPQDAGIQGRMEFEVTPGVEFTLELDPGIAVGEVTYFPDQKITAAYLHDGTSTRWRRDPSSDVALDRLDPIAASELMRDLTDMTN